jgi:hypothetical protein
VNVVNLLSAGCAVLDEVPVSIAIANPDNPGLNQSRQQVSWVEATGQRLRGWIPFPVVLPIVAENDWDLCYSTAVSANTANLEGSVTVNVHISPSVIPSLNRGFAHTINERELPADLSIEPKDEEVTLVACHSFRRCNDDFNVAETQ